LQPGVMDFAHVFTLADSTRKCNTTVRMGKLQTLTLSFRNNRFHDTVYFALMTSNPAKTA
jgi:hypothetical protein